MTREPKKFNWWYDHIIDWMIANPDKKLKDCAASLGKSAVWVRDIIRSDMFKVRYEMRKRQFSADLDEDIRTRTSEVALAALDGLLDRLTNTEQNRPASLADLTTIADKALTRLGYGAPALAAGAGVVVNVGVSAGTLREAQDDIRRQQQQIAGAGPSPFLIEGEPAAPEGEMDEVEEELVPADEVTVADLGFTRRRGRGRPPGPSTQRGFFESDLSELSEGSSDDPPLQSDSVAAESEEGDDDDLSFLAQQIGPVS